MSEEAFEIRNLTRGTTPDVPFRAIKEAIVGKQYSLSLALIGCERSRTLNKKYRGKDKIANVLSFPLDDKEGEIFIAPVHAKKEAKKFGKTHKQMIGFLFIHGLLHLKGMEHGSTMEKAEQKYCAQFHI